MEFISLTEVTQRSMKLTFRDQEWILAGGITVREAIRQIGLEPESVLATREGQLINETTVLKEDDEIKLVGVISGGENNSDYLTRLR